MGFPETTFLNIHQARSEKNPEYLNINILNIKCVFARQEEMCPRFSSSLWTAGFPALIKQD